MIPRPSDRPSRSVSTSATASCQPHEVRTWIPDMHEPRRESSCALRKLAQRGNRRRLPGQPYAALRPRNGLRGRRPWPTAMERRRRLRGRSLRRVSRAARGGLPPPAAAAGGPLHAPPPATGVRRVGFRADSDSNLDHGGSRRITADPSAEAALPRKPAGVGRPTQAGSAGGPPRFICPDKPSRGWPVAIHSDSGTARNRTRLGHDSDMTRA